MKIEKGKKPEVKFLPPKKVRKKLEQGLTQFSHPYNQKHFVKWQNCQKQNRLIFTEKKGVKRAEPRMLLTLSSVTKKIVQLYAQPNSHNTETKFQQSKVMTMEKKG